ncbi:hypothetical protein CY35_04G080600 [Sphagnum magellanicum]|nr:hypothetical protein CY35_04G080600 [Sphagnum magellanicum]
MEAIEGESKEETAAESTERKGTSRRRLINRKRLISSAVPDKKQQLLLRRRSSSCGAASDESDHQMAFGSPSSKSSGRGFSSTRKRKRGRRRILIHPDELEDVVKPELDADQEFDAAQALFQLLGAGVSVSNPATKPAAAAAATAAMMLHWTGKKTRSNRSSTKASRSLTTSITVSCQILPPPPASSLDLFSSSSRAAAAPVEVEVVDHEMIFDSRVKQEVEEEEGCEMSDAKSSGIVDVVVGVDVEQQQVKLVSESSLESMQLDSSRAVSPSSPLPVLFRADVTKNIVRPNVTTNTTTTTTTQSAFVPVMPMLPQPLKKLSVFQKPKIEDELPESYIMAVMKEEWKQGTRGRIPSWISSETGSQVMASSKKAEGFEGFGIQQGPAAFLNEFSNGRNNIVKSGEGNHLKLLHSVTRLKEEENKVDSCSSGLNIEEIIRQKRQKRSAASTQGRTALSEVERETRRLRRIQANRESARQTIRRKQVLCEELGQRAAALVAEKEDLQQKVERQTAEYRLLLEMNMRLKEQADNKELTRASSKLSSSAVPVMPMSPLLGLRLPPFCWALALAQGAAAGQASVEQAVARTLGLQQQNPMLLAAAAMAATATFNNGIRLPSLWMGKGGENIASTSSLVPKPATESVVDNQQSPTTTSVSVPSIPPALSDVLPEKNCVSFAGERNKNLETVQITREGQFLAPKVEEVAVKSGASNVKSQQRQSSGPPAESSPPLLSLVQPSLTTARPSASLQSNHHVLGIPYVNKEINQIVFSSYRNGRQAGFMGGGAIYGTMPINSGGTTVAAAAAAAAAEARRRRIEELKRSRTLQRSRSAPSRSAPRLTVSTLAL